MAAKPTRPVPARTARTVTSTDPAFGRILDAATRLFYYQGIPNTGIDAITETAGTAKMSLYRNFGSKDALIVECLNRLDVRFHDWFVTQVEDRTCDPREKLLSAFDVLDEWINSSRFRGCAFINATVELADPRHPAKEAVLAHKRRNRDYIEELARACNVSEPTALARQLMLLIEGAMVTALVQEDRHAAQDAKQAARALLSATMGGNGATRPVANSRAGRPSEP